MSLQIKPDVISSDHAQQICDDVSFQAQDDFVHDEDNESSAVAGQQQSCTVNAPISTYESSKLLQKRGGGGKLGCTYAGGASRIEELQGKVPKKKREAKQEVKSGLVSGCSGGLVQKVSEKATGNVGAPDSNKRQCT